MRSLRIALFLILLICVFLAIFFLFGIEKYNAQEKLAKEEITMMCIATSVANILNDYYQKNGSYPVEDSVYSVILENGFPGKLGCGPVERDATEEDEKTHFNYSYLSPSGVDFYISKKDLIFNRYVLRNGILVK